MKHLLARSTATLLGTAGALALGLGVAAAQTYDKPSKPAQEHSAAQGTKAGHEAKLTAELVDKEAKARKQTATVKVTVTGVRIIDPATVGEKPAKGQGHFHYQVDDGPVIATTAPKLSFHDLKPGPHKIMVVLAANDHTPLGPQQTLEVTIPSTTAGR